MPSCCGRLQSAYSNNQVISIFNLYLILLATIILLLQLKLSRAALPSISGTCVIIDTKFLFRDVGLIL